MEIVPRKTETLLLDKEMVEFRHFDFEVLPDLLPHLPSQLLRVALDDMRAAKTMPRVVLDMDSWFVPAVDDQQRAAAGLGFKNECQVCFAGCTLLGTYKLRPWDQCYPGVVVRSFRMSSSTLAQKFEFLDQCRRFGMRQALDCAAGWTRTLAETGVVVPTELERLIHEDERWLSSTADLLKERSLKEFFESEEDTSPAFETYIEKLAESFAGLSL